MDIILLFFIVAVSGLGAKAFSKLCSNILVHSSVAKYSLVLMVNSLVACIVFFSLSGLALSINETTFIYSAIYALVVAAVLISNFVIYRYANISNANILSRASNMVCSVLLGVLFFSETIDLTKLLRIALMLLAILFVFIDQRNANVTIEKKTGPTRTRNIGFVLVMFAVTVSTCASTAVLKSFAMSEKTTDENSFFFFTNAILFVATFLIFLFACLKNKAEFRSSISLLSSKRLISIVGNTICSNATSIASVYIVAKMDISTYSPISSAIGVIAGLAASLIFREKIGLFSYISVVIACIAVIV